MTRAAVDFDIAKAKSSAERYWRREAEDRARLVRHLEVLLVFERNRIRWQWCLVGVVVGTLIGLCLEAWRIA